MKRLLLYCVALLFCSFLNAQPVLTANTNNPNPGDYFNIYYCDTTGITPGSPGPGIVWDFSGIAVNDYDSVRYFTCSATPYCDTFPGSTLASITRSLDYQYYITDSVTYNCIGSKIISGSACWRYTNPASIIDYPATFGSVKIDSFRSNYDQHWFEVGVDTVIGDGYGTLVLPSGTFNNVLRMRTIRSEADSSTTNPITHNRREFYSWYMNGYHYPLLQIYVANSIVAPHAELVLYTDQLPAVVENIGSLSNRICVFPNPATNKINISFPANAAGAGAVLLTDVAGHVVHSIGNIALSAGTNKIELSSEDLLPGIYFLKLHADARLLHGVLTIVK